MVLLNIFLSAFLIFSADHDYHVGIYEIEFKGDRFQISQKLFTDDFEKALKLNGSDFIFSEENKDPAFLKLIQLYINDHFSLSIKNEVQKLNFIGMEWEDYHVVYLYWESEKIPTDFNSFEIRNDIFLEISDEQKNMHHIKVNGKESNLLLEKGRTEGIVTLSK